MSSFVFEISIEEQEYLKKLAFLSIKSGIDGRERDYPTPPSNRLKEHLGAFVTLKINGNLRGCIGNISGEGPLWKTIIRMAREAAFNDPRFPALTSQELQLLELEISILSPLEPVPDIDLIEPGKHGLVISKGPHSGLLLPQVALEWGWDRETFLAHTCRKAGLHAHCYKDKSVRILWFQAVVF
ncbi:AmmeMemoRadiSam system protein A [Desulfonatronospira sp.]|uniref:AmmeMemoRadiSam system protein A n=1 Tax=Desulfonatronospira sp. TaxID=1962951 RepID=UPI0025B9FC87|nr:AmmeMemoRadiSam system protein A [Desulfonatronospira sp.]